MRQHAGVHEYATSTRPTLQIIYERHDGDENNIISVAKVLDFNDDVRACQKECSPQDSLNTSSNYSKNAKYYTVQRASSTYFRDTFVNLFLAHHFFSNNENKRNPSELASLDRKSFIVRGVEPTPCQI